MSGVASAISEAACEHAPRQFDRLCRLPIPDNLPIDVAIWHLAFPDAPGAPHNALTPDDWRELGRLPHTDARRRAFAVRAALRQVLSIAVSGAIAPAAWRFERNAYGKLLLAAGFPTIDFSISHAAHGSCIAVSTQGRVGLDIADDISAVDTADLIETFFTRQERNMLKRAPQSRRQHEFLRIWTAREAFAKLLGVGLSMDAPANDCGLGTHLASWSASTGSRELFVSLAVDPFSDGGIGGIDPNKNCA